MTDVQKVTLIHNSPFRRDWDSLPREAKRAVLDGIDEGLGESLVGQQFSLLTVIEYAGREKNKYIKRWKCQCVCGQIKTVRGQHLKAGRIRSCGKHFNVGPNNYQWKGDSVGIGALHHRVRRQRGSASKCTNPDCKAINPTMFHWANISHEYKRDVNDFMELCALCHKAYDRRSHCKRGHPFNQSNTGRDHRGDRFCKRCKAALSAKYRKQRKVIAEAAERYE